MLPRFAANLTFMWGELPFLERFGAARQAGFSRVEYMFPYEFPFGELRSRLDDAGLEQVLFNLPAGDWGAGDRGIAADPTRVDEFRTGVDRALEYAEALGVERLNCLAGLHVEGVDLAVQRTVLVASIHHAATRLAASGRTLLLEPVNTFDVPGFLVPTTTEALALIDEAGEGNVRLQFDAYHVARMEGDPATILEPVLDRVGHVQIADHPGRNQPGSGEIDFASLFALLDRARYAGTIGLEYIPAPSTDQSLGWLERYGLVPS
jgi:hydroxypyruvate isomerase